MGDADETGPVNEAETGLLRVGFGIAVGLLVVAFVGATRAGVLDFVGPYLVAISVLVGILFVLGRKGTV